MDKNTPKVSIKGMGSATTVLQKAAKQTTPRA